MRHPNGPRFWECRLFAAKSIGVLHLRGFFDVLFLDCMCKRIGFRSVPHSLACEARGGTDLSGPLSLRPNDFVVREGPISSPSYFFGPALRPPFFSPVLLGL